MPPISKRIIADPADAEKYGGITDDLREAVRSYPDHSLGAYHRVSSRAQKANGSLANSAKNLRAEMRRIAPKKRLRNYEVVEEGKLSKKRPGLRHVLEIAREDKLILVAWDLSRWIRAEAYNRRNNREAVPTAEEFAKLRELAGDVPLVTIYPLTLTESERHSIATKRSEQCGRKPTISGRLKYQILDAYDQEKSYREIAKQFDVSLGAVQRVLNETNPCDPAGHKWKDYAFAGGAYLKAREKAGGWV